MPARSVSIADHDAEEATLAAEGKLRLPSGPLPPSFFKRRGPRVAPPDVLRALRAERDEDCDGVPGPDPARRR
jgi:hypothetical protein